MTTRRALLAAAGATLATPSVAAPALAAPALAAQPGTRTLRFIPNADLAWFDPSFWPFLETRNHAMMVYDTLFATDAEGRIQPQMAEGHRVEDDGRTWTIRLREDLAFHNGEPVLARDCVASILRWGNHAAMGQSLLAATQELVAADDRTIVFRLGQRFPLLSAALGSQAMQVCAIMPAWLLEGMDFLAITQVVGSGPYRYLADERVPGKRLAYARNAAYVPRATGTPSFLAGPKHAHFDRVEWLPMGAEAAQEALQSGRADWWQSPPAAAHPALAANPALVLALHDRAGFMGTLRLNHLVPPFSTPAACRALLPAIDQAAFMQAASGAGPEFRRDGVGFFCPESPMASQAGIGALRSPPDLAAARGALEAAGALGAPITVLSIADMPAPRAMATMGAEMLRRLGLEVEVVQVPLRNLIARLLRTQPSGAGGWNAVFGYWSGHDMWDPGMHRYLRGEGPSGEVGWPTSDALEAMRRAWLATPDLAVRRTIAAEMQVQAFQDVPYIPLGQWQVPTAYDRRLQGMLQGYPLFWNLRREG
jgi:peptide/nickel transport system substrate-binding protein